MQYLFEYANGRHGCVIKKAIYGIGITGHDFRHERWEWNKKVNKDYSIYSKKRTEQVEKTQKNFTQEFKRVMTKQ